MVRTRGTRGIRWRDLTMEHQKAISFYTSGKGAFPAPPLPCMPEYVSFFRCLLETADDDDEEEEDHAMSFDKCKAEKAEFYRCAGNTNWDVRRERAPPRPGPPFPPLPHAPPRAHRHLPSSPRVARRKTPAGP
jgi:hypothetical protein